MRSSRVCITERKRVETKDGCVPCPYPLVTMTTKSLLLATTDEGMLPRLCLQRSLACRRQTRVLLRGLRAGCGMRNGFVMNIFIARIIIFAFGVQIGARFHVYKRRRLEIFRKGIWVGRAPSQSDSLPGHVTKFKKR